MKTNAVASKHQGSTVEKATPQKLNQDG